MTSPALPAELDEASVGASDILVCVLLFPSDYLLGEDVRVNVTVPLYIRTN